MDLGTFSLIVTSVALSALAQISFKFGLSSTAGPAGGFPNALLSPGVLAGLALYGFGTLLWLTALSKVEVSQAYPFVGLGFALTAVLGHIVFGDSVGAQRVLGIVVVIIGIIFIARS